MSSRRNQMQTLADLQSENERLARVVEELKAENYKLREHNQSQDRQLASLRASVAKLKEVARFFRAQRDRVDAYLSGVLDQIREERAANRGGPDHHELDAKLRDIVRDTDQMLDRYRMAQHTQRPHVREPFVSERDAGQGRHTFQTYRDAEPDQSWEEL